MDDYLPSVGYLSMDNSNITNYEKKKKHIYWFFKMLWLANNKLNNLGLILF